MFNKEEIVYYSKQMLLPEIGKSGQEKLKNARVLVVGAGGLGCPVLLYLAAAGIGTIGIADFDKVDQTNLQRQILYSTNDIGRNKAVVATEKIKNTNPYIRVEAIRQKLEVINALDLIGSYDIVVDCSDNIETRYLINDACVLNNKPFVYGGIHKFEGQVAVFNFKSSGYEGPTYRCVFPEPHPEESLLNCAQTGVIGTVPGIIGTLQANEGIKLITGIGSICSGRMLILNALTLQFSEIKIKRNVSGWNDMPGTKEDFLKKNYFGIVKSIA
jgi:molybdopterin/thiamine biosynthesis adenylyltransferase